MRRWIWFPAQWPRAIPGRSIIPGFWATTAVLAIPNVTQFWLSGKVNAAPELFAGHIDASLIHEAAIGKIAGEQIIKLRTLGLTEEEAEERIIQGFCKAKRIFFRRDQRCRHCYGRPAAPAFLPYDCTGRCGCLLFKERISSNIQRIFLGFAAGVMIAASVWSL